MSTLYLLATKIPRQLETVNNIHSSAKVTDVVPKLTVKPPGKHHDELWTRSPQALLLHSFLWLSNTESLVLGKTHPLGGHLHVFKLDQGITIIWIISYVPSKLDLVSCIQTLLSLSIGYTIVTLSFLPLPLQSSSPSPSFHKRNSPLPSSLPPHLLPCTSLSLSPFFLSLPGSAFRACCFAG